MADREKIIRYYKGTDGAAAAVQLVDMAETVARGRKFKVSGFLDPFGQEIAVTVAANYPNIKLDFFGGYEGAERQKALFVHEDFPGKALFQVAAVKVSWNEQFYRISHRDVLGSLLGTGIERGVVGDILLKNGDAKIVLDAAMLDFVKQNFHQIASANVMVEDALLEEIEPKTERCKEIKATVASLRIDSVAAAGFGSSRSKISEDISADKLKLNWQAVKSPSQMVKAGDIISMRGRGRVEVAEIGGQTKKGRTGVFLKRYL